MEPHFRASVADESERAGASFAFQMGGIEKTRYMEVVGSGGHEGRRR